MNYKPQDGEVLFCGNCQLQFTVDKVNDNFTCMYCKHRVTSWYQYQTQEDAMRVWNNVNGKTNTSFSPINFSNMANNQIERQIELLQDAKTLFTQHAELVEEIRLNFAGSVRGLEQNELNQDYMDFLEEFLGDYMIKLGAIRETIEDEYLPALIRKIRYLEERE